MNVCAVLVNYRGAGEIARAVMSVLADAPGIDIVVVDNSDDPQEWAHLESMLPLSVRRVRAPGNIGFGQGCNLAMGQTQASFIFLVNPDVRLLPGCTQALHDTLLASPELAAVSPRQFLDNGCQWLLPPSWLPTALRSWVEERALRQPQAARRLARAARSENLRFWTTSQPIRQRALSGGAMMVRRSALMPGEPLFDPRYFMYFEDTDLCMRLRRRGLHLAVVPAARAIHAWRNQPHKATMMAASGKVYFDKFFPSDSTWMTKSRTVAEGPISTPYDFTPFPAGGVQIPAHWHGNWLLELSPSPLIQPAIALFGRGSHLKAPSDVLPHFESASVFGRLSCSSSPDDPRLNQYFCWPSVGTSCVE